MEKLIKISDTHYIVVGDIAGLSKFAGGFIWEYKQLNN